MIFYGIKSKVVKKENVSYYKCNQCNDINTTEISILSRYFHIYWIPFIPLNKKAIAFCNNCETETKKKHFSEQLKLAYLNVKSTIKTSFWHFSGLLIISFLIGVVLYSSGQTAKNKIIFINNPKVDDVYYTKIEKDVYSTLKVGNVTLDSIYLFQNSLTVNGSFKNNSIDKPENYESMEMLILSKEDVLALFKDKTIYSVRR